MNVKSVVLNLYPNNNPYRFNKAFALALIIILKDSIGPHTSQCSNSNNKNPDRFNRASHWLMLGP